MLPPAVLEQLHPLNPADAERVHRDAVEERPSGNSYTTSDPDPVGVRIWLRRVQPDLAARVYVSWDQDSAIETTWSIFTEYWDDFCYPSSDDVTVLPITGGWWLEYRHYEEFKFGAV
jgi:hypothetical protein